MRLKKKYIERSEEAGCDNSLLNQFNPTTERCDTRHGQHNTKVKFDKLKFF